MNVWIYLFTERNQLRNRLSVAENKLEEGKTKTYKRLLSSKLCHQNFMLNYVLAKLVVSLIGRN